MILRNLFDIECEALHDLATLVERRAAAEVATNAAYDAAKTAANREITRARKTIAGERERELTSIQSAWEETRRNIESQFQEKQTAAERLQQFTIQEARDRSKSEGVKTQSAYSDALWTADSLHEAAEKQASDQRLTLERKAAAAAEAITTIGENAQPWLERGGIAGLVSLEIEATLSPDDSDAESDGPRLIELDTALVHADDALTRLRDLRILRYTRFRGFLLWLLVFGAVAAVPAILMPDERYWLIGGIPFALIAAFLALGLTRKRATRRALEIAEEMSEFLRTAERERQGLLVYAVAEQKRQLISAVALRDDKKLKAQSKYPPILAKTADRETRDIAVAADKFERDSEKIRTWYYDSLRKAEEHFTTAVSECHARHDKALTEADSLFEQRKIESRSERERAWNALCNDWREGQDRLGKIFNLLKGEGMENCTDWDSPFWQSPPPAEHLPRGVRFGDIAIDLHSLPNGVPTDEDLEPTIPARMRLPAFLPFPNRTALLMKTRDHGRAVAVQSLQSMMLRFLTAVPAGKVRFTVIDPVGLGDNFAAFMHLADFDEHLIGSRIWTEVPQIEKRLADLTAHMENVIQKYLRSQFRTIEEYNAQAGEVAEPFRVLVIANFPAGFSLESARRLVSIVNSGSTCGVFTLMSVDTRLPVPQGFNLSDLEQASLVLPWKNDAFAWKDGTLAQFPLSLEMPPNAEKMVRLVRTVGERSRDTNRVEVPFDFVAPGTTSAWTRDSRKGLTVPIGRSGATKRQLFQVGQGTAQHALIAGKTGSGKSTLLHALITNLALHYSPAEVELYLIDFKKGVEFKTYATNRLPHAKVIAIESEREFGLSVLQRLDAELRERGERFRTAGVNGLEDYRDWRDQQPPDSPLPKTMPRIMLIVDEFQEFFVEDDRLSQEAALLLDRLVRQGRAFGLHLLLGSQTLGGAYSLARSTIDQMAIRIALQCSDADAQLILSKDNTAARLLSRPGEAIYNDANGLIEGNDLFQIVWLGDTQKEDILRELAREAERVNGSPLPPPLVFEGNVDSDIAGNRMLREVLALPRPTEFPKSASAWLGDAVAIKDPTAAIFRPQSSSNLLMVGQHEQAAPALFTAAMLSLAAQQPTAARFVILDGTPDDDLNAGCLGRAAAVLPHRVDFLDRTNFAAAFTALQAEVNARNKNETPDRSPIYLMILALHRFRDLRRDEEMSFGRRGPDRPVTPIEAFASITRDGPGVGIHTLVWCDALTNLNRCVDRQGLREFGMRVLFQMSANDSSTLIDTPTASRLGRHRALFVTEEMPNPEKFRPYGFPTTDWLRSVRESLAKS